MLACMHTQRCIHPRAQVCEEEGPGKAEGAGGCFALPCGLQVSPNTVRPLMLAAGDLRDGATLMAEMEQDMERMRISNLRKTPEGR
jgi:hypothetical protein